MTMAMRADDAEEIAPSSAGGLARAVGAYAAAREDAEREVAALLLILRGAASSRAMEPRARTAMEAVSMLWETAARLNEYPA